VLRNLNKRKSARRGDDYDGATSSLCFTYRLRLHLTVVHLLSIMRESHPQQ